MRCLLLLALLASTADADPPKLTLPQTIEKAIAGPRARWPRRIASRRGALAGGRCHAAAARQDDRVRDGQPGDPLHRRGVHHDRPEELRAAVPGPVRQRADRRDPADLHVRQDRARPRRRARRRSMRSARSPTRPPAISRSMPRARTGASSSRASSAACSTTASTRSPRAAKLREKQGRVDPGSSQRVAVLLAEAKAQRADAPRRPRPRRSPGCTR